MPSYPFSPQFDSSPSHCSVHGVNIEMTPCPACLRETGQVRSDFPAATPRPHVHPADEDRIARQSLPPFRRIVHTVIDTPSWLDDATMEEGDQANDHRKEQ